MAAASEEQDTSERLIQEHFETKHPQAIVAGHCKYSFDLYEEGAKVKVGCTLCDGNICTFSVPIELFASLRIDKIKSTPTESAKSRSYIT